MQQIKESRSGFTLIELLLAIFIVSLFGYFIFATPSGAPKTQEKVTISNLPNFYQKNLHGDGEVVCIKKCKECYYLTGSKKPQSAPIPMVLNVQEQFSVDKNGNAIKLHLGRFKDEKVCMRFRHYKNGSITPMILNLGNQVLFLPSYFGEGKSFSSVSDAASWWLRNSQNALRSRGEWY